MSEVAKNLFAFEAPEGSEYLENETESVLDPDSGYNPDRKANECPEITAFEKEAIGSARVKINSKITGME